MSGKVNIIFRKALESVYPSLIVKGYSEKIRSYYEMKGFQNLMVVGFGKASYEMAKAIEDVFGQDIISDGVVVTKYGHAKKNESGVGSQELKKIRVYEAGHPIPDENGIRASEEIVELVNNADENTLVLCLVSGGGSALFVSPCEGITLEEKQSITDMLLKAGADITELNSVRKHLSKVKGGRLAEAAYPAEVISLMISDVIGDSLDVIASGPTAPDGSTYQDALDVISRYGLSGSAPESVMDVLRNGIEGTISDTPKKGSREFQKVQNIIIGSNRIAIEAAKSHAQSMEYQTEILSIKVEGEAGKAAKWLAEKAFEAQSGHLTRSRRKARSENDSCPLCLISGGETTVQVKGKGKGGRNTELALIFAMEIDGAEGITMLSAGTDGTDGPTDAAGAIVDGSTMEKARKLGLNPQQYLDNNDSYNFFKEIDGLLITGPTGTNVMDVQIVVVE
jgi:hydroxypyruvate reductase/glycerate 2-kinase